MHMYIYYKKDITALDFRLIRAHPLSKIVAIKFVVSIVPTKTFPRLYSNPLMISPNRPLLRRDAARTFLGSIALMFCVRRPPPQWSLLLIECRR